MTTHRLPYAGSAGEFIRTPLLRSLQLLLFIALFTVACTGEGNQEREAPAASALSDVPTEVPEEFQEGKTKFQQYCIQCHGEWARGTSVGPPLVHIYYEPNHHADITFLIAAQRGVVQHHWNFGNMPPVTGVSPEEVAQITAYIRWLQREAGIY